MKLLTLILVSCSLTAAGQTPFRAFESYENLIEGGRVHTLVLESGREHLVTRVPKDYGVTVESETKSVVLRESAGTISITIRMTTNSPGVLPDDNALRASALAADAGGAFLQIAGCATGYRPARFVDSVRSLDPKRAFRTRHAFVACPEGMVEFVFSSKDEAFDKGRVVFNLFLSSFRLEMIQQPVKVEE